MRHTPQKEKNDTCGRGRHIAQSASQMNICDTPSTYVDESHAVTDFESVIIRDVTDHIPLSSRAARHGRFYS